jgi:hypothetical protein
MAYTKTVNFSSSDNYGSGPETEDDVYTIEEFKRFCKNGGFLDCDGFGHPVRDNKCDPDIFIKPSRLKEIPNNATHIIWYNR